VNVAVVAPCPVPYAAGGAENLWRGLQDALNAATGHQAEIIKLPSPEHDAWSLLDSYQRFSELDLSGFDVVVSGKYPAWMVSHPRHVCWMLHRLRGLYDSYHFFGMPERYPNAPPPVAELRAWMNDHTGSREALGEFFQRVNAMRGARGLPADLFAFPGPFIRELVHHLDGIGLAPHAVRRFGAISATVRDRPGYFPDGADAFVAHPPTSLSGLRPRRGSYLFTASRLDPPKRIDVIVRAMEHVTTDVELRVAGTGPQAGELAALAEGDPRIRLLGHVSEPELARLYNDARAVAFIPYAEDYGYVTLEGMLSGAPVITATDSGGPTELVDDGVTGLVVEPEPRAVAAAVDRLWRRSRDRRRMSRAALRRAHAVTWDAVLSEIVA
jgi:glycosyltransferase involved in cell wall biosynthesis